MFQERACRQDLEGKSDEVGDEERRELDATCADKAVSTKLNMNRAGDLTRAGFIVRGFPTVPDAQWKTYRRQPFSCL